MSEQFEVRPPRPSYFHLILRRFGDTPATQAAILEGTGLSETDVDDPLTEIGFLQQLRQFENMTRLFGEGWQLVAPELWRPAAHGALGIALVTAPDVGAAVEILAKYISAHAPNQRFKLTRGSNSVALRHSLPLPLPEDLWRLVVEAVFLGSSASLALPLGSARRELRYEFVWPEPTYGEKLTELLAGQLRWGAPANAMIIPRRLLSLRSPLADAALCQHALGRLEQAAAIVTAPDGIKTRMAQLLASSDTGRLPSSFVARSLGLSQRTLARRLALAGTSYRELVDEELRARARRWLDLGVLSRGEIGERLGFADATGFSRACRRWFKMDA